MVEEIQKVVGQIGIEDIKFRGVRIVAIILARHAKDDGSIPLHRSMFSTTRM